MTNENRVPAGVPTGGQFAAGLRSAATDITLAPDSAATHLHAMALDTTLDEARENDEALEDLLEDLAEQHHEHPAAPGCDADTTLRDWVDTGFYPGPVNRKFGGVATMRTAVDALHLGDHHGIESVAKGALEHLTPNRRETLEAALHPNGAPIEWDGPMHEATRNVLHATLVDVTQDAPTQQVVANMEANLHTALASLTDAHVERDLGRPDRVDEARRAAEHVAIMLDRTKSMRQDAALRRIDAGRPTLFDMREAQASANEARDAARRAVNAADAARYSAVRRPDDAHLAAAAAKATEVEHDALETHRHHKEVLARANAAWTVQKDEISQ